MFHQVIVDTGVLVALIDRRDRYHTWVTKQLTQIAPPLLTCEAVISEAWFLLQRVKNGRETLLQLLNHRQVEVQFDLDSELEAVIALLARYQSVPVSLADTEYHCLQYFPFLYYIICNMSEEPVGSNIRPSIWLRICGDTSTASCRQPNMSRLA